MAKAVGTGVPRRSDRAWTAALALGLAFLLGPGEAAAQTPCRPFVTTDRTSSIYCHEDFVSTHDIHIDARNPAITTADDTRSGIYGDHSGTGGIDIDVQGGSIETTGTFAGGIVAWQKGSGNIAIDVRTRMINVPFGNGVYGRLSGANAARRIVISHEGEVKARDTGLLAWAEPSSGSTFGDGARTADDAVRTEPTILVTSSGDVTVGGSVMDELTRTDQTINGERAPTTARDAEAAAIEILKIPQAGIRAMVLSHVAIANHVRNEDQLSAAERTVLEAVLTGGDVEKALGTLPASYTDVWKDGVRRHAESYNAGDIRVDVTGGTIISGGDGVHARYVLLHDKNGAIAVTVAEGASVTGRRNGIYVGGAGLVTGSSNPRDQDQTVTVNGVVMGGTGAGVHMAGGRRLVVGRTGSIGADSDVGVLADGPGDFHAMVDGTVNGHIRRMGDGALSATVTGTIDGNIEGLGGGEHTVSVPVGGTVTGTVRLDGSTVTVGGTVGRITLNDGGTVRIASTGQVSGVSVGNHGVSVGPGGIIENHGTITGKVGIQAGAGSSVTNSGTVRSTDGADGIAIDFPEAGENTLTLQEGTMISGKIRGVNTLDLSKVPADKVGLLTFADETDMESITIMRPTGGIGRVINAGSARVGLDTTAFALTDDMLSDLTGSIHAAVIDNGVPAYAHDGNPARRRVWATPFGGAREQNGTDRLADGTHYFGGGLLGADWGTDTRIGAFVGGSVGQLDVTGNRHTIDMQTVFGGVYARQELGDVLLDARMLIGSMDHDSARRIGPTGTAEVEYTGLLLSPEVGVAMRLQVSTRLHATPRLRVRYTKLTTEDFRERVPGTNWDLRFAERDVQVLEARGEVGLPVELEAGGWIDPRVGIEGRWLMAGETIEAAVPGGAFRVSAGGETGVATGTVGLGLTLSVTESTSLVGNFEGAYTTERAWRATGYLGLMYSF